MEKPARGSMKFGVALAVAAGLAGCRILERDALTQDQQSELTSYAQAYHFCVARAAKRLDDGHSAIVQIAASALNYCRPEARSVAVFLDSTKLSDTDKAAYVGELIQTAANKSTVMLRHLRDREEGVSDI